MENITIRFIRQSELPVLEEFLYQAIFQREGEPLLPRSVILEPAIAVYIKDFGKPGDYCLVAEECRQILGAVWVRILSGEVKGFGNINDKTPEFAISVLPEHRGRGIGKKLMQEMLKLLKEKRVRQASLAVQKDNFAFKLYQAAGFDIIDTTDQEYIMAVQLQ